jgi:phage tail-like protein
MEPFTAFNFEVAIGLPGSAAALCEAAFAECDGLELSFEVKTIREGGNNGVQRRLTGPATYGNVTLKRGMTTGFDLWNWVQRVQREPGVRATAQITLFSPDRTRRAAIFTLERCLPAKFKAPPLNAKDGMVAVEELQLVYESLSLRSGDA